MPEKVVDEKTSVKLPIKTVLALLAGCATFTGGAVKLGEYVGGSAVQAADIERRVAVVEQRVNVISLVDRRLARIEGALHVRVPEEERLPAGK
jgi:hypothetical protein